MLTNKEKWVIYKMIGTINKAFGGSSNISVMDFFDKLYKEVVWIDAEINPHVNMTSGEITETLTNMSNESKKMLNGYLQELAEARRPIDPVVAEFIEHVKKVQQGIMPIESNRLYKYIWR